MAVFVSSVLTCVVGCGDDGGSSVDASTSPADTSTSTSPEDTSTSPEDTSTSTSPEDTSTSPEDTSTSPEDTSTSPEDTSTSTSPGDTSTSPEDTSTSPEDTSTGDATAALCACEGGATCLEAKGAEACATLAGTCGGGDLHLVERCDPAEAEATCERASTTTYYYWARIDGWLKGAKEACAATLPGPAGTFTVATIPEPSGDPCSCQRTASACTELWGDGCATFTCDAGVQTAVCAAANSLPGRCVTRDGQRALVFYAPLSAALAETTCNGASVADYYWFPAGL